MTIVGVYQMSGVIRDSLPKMEWKLLVFTKCIHILLYEAVIGDWRHEIECKLLVFIS